MNSLKGKKLLVLGGAPNEFTLVTRARELGVYVIVADYHTDYTLSPAKNLANEAWTISWSDLDALEQKCREEKVDGVLAGYSEIRMEMVIRLCQRLGFPCYCNMEQLDITRDKVQFKEACRRSGVPVVKEYACVDDVDQYPVIVKPVDRAGSIGISVATNREELDRAYAYAMDMSLRKQVIIEKYITDATKVDVYYQIVNGEVFFISGNDVINAKDNGTDRVVQSAWLLPSIHLSQFKEKVDASMRDMIRAMDIQNGYVFFSGFADKQGEFVFFESGFRLCGGHYYDYFHRLGGYQTLDMLISFALTGAVAAGRHSQPDPQLKCVTLNLYAKAGTIASISGMDEVQKIPGCILALTHARVGQVCRDDVAILSKLAIIHLCGHDEHTLAENVKKVYELVDVRSTEGEDMIYDRVDPEMISCWWNA